MSNEITKQPFFTSLPTEPGFYWAQRIWWVSDKTTDEGRRMDTHNDLIQIFGTIPFLTVRVVRWSRTTKEAADDDNVRRKWIRFFPIAMPEPINPSDEGVSQTNNE
jgi:hypothetical protein